MLGYFGAVAEFEKGEFHGKSITAIGVAPTFRLPLDFGLFCVSPKAEVGLKVAFGDPRGSQFYWGAGVETTFNFGNQYIRPGLEVSYRSITGKYHQNFDDLEVKSSGILIKAIVGISLD